MARYRLWAVFRSHQWPLRDGEYLEVRTEGLETVARVPTELVEALIAHHLDGLAVQAYLARALEGAWRDQSPSRIVLPARKPLMRAAVDSAVQRAELRAKRRSRRSPG